MSNPINAQSGNPLKTNPSTYGFVSTEKMIERFNNAGWELQKTQIARIRKQSNDGFQRHMLTFTHKELSNAPLMRREHAGLLTLNFLNSHDATSAARLGIGFYRGVCMNGLWLGSELSSFRAIHSQRFIKNLEDMIDDAAASIPKALDRMSQLQDITLRPDQYEALASSMAIERLKPLGPKVGLIDIKSMLRPRRQDDTGNDAFTVLNRLQEKLIRGGIRYEKREAQNHNGLVQYVHAGHAMTRKLSSVPQSVRLNKLIFDQTYQMIKAA